MDGFGRRQRVVVIAATNEPDKIDVALRRAGRFDREYKVGLPDVDERVDILKVLTRGSRLDKDVDLAKLAKDTPGFAGADLSLLVKEAVLEAHRRYYPLRSGALTDTQLKKVSLSVADIKTARGRVSPSLVRELGIEKPDVKWADVGGLSGIVTKLKKVVVGPLTNPAGFARLGLKPQKGVLFDGPPGVGKTLVAKALAGEMGFNFINVKASQLVTEYYGESSRNVRKLFERARELKPAIIFIDEIDSLIPERGGLSQGELSETTRVISELLSQMDGVQGLDQVMVIGATNRAEAIDEAFLRPGRFGKPITFTLPDRRGRESIFHATTRNMAINGDVDFAKLAAQTNGFSGADIAGLAFAAGERALEEDPEATSIRMKHFVDALRTTSASVTAEATRLRGGAEAEAPVEEAPVEDAPKTRWKGAVDHR
jgi:transitional endoplasmic reticulum ATPase